MKYRLPSLTITPYHTRKTMNQPDPFALKVPASSVQDQTFSFDFDETADLNLEKFDGGSGDGGSYAPAEPGFYLANIREVYLNEFRAGKNNLASEDGKWRHIKLSPQIEVKGRVGHRRRVRPHPRRVNKASIGRPTAARCPAPDAVRCCQWIAPIRMTPRIIAKTQDFR